MFSLGIISLFPARLPPKGENIAVVVVRALTSARTPTPRRDPAEDRCERLRRRV